MLHWTLAWHYSMKNSTVLHTNSGFYLIFHEILFALKINNGKKYGWSGGRWMGTPSSWWRGNFFKNTYLVLLSVFIFVQHTVYKQNIKIFNEFQMEHTDEPMENPQEVITECLSKFCTPDYIMEPGIFSQLKR